MLLDREGEDGKRMILAREEEEEGMILAREGEKGERTILAREG